MVADFHSYCAICSCPLRPVDVGSRSPDHLKRRRERVARIRKLQEAEERGDTVDDDEYEALEPDDGEYDDEDHSYDPDLVGGRAGLEWLGHISCLGYNSTTEKAFISGDTSYDDCTLIDVEIGDDPNQPDDIHTFTCYYNNQRYKWAVYPFHSCCLKILSRVLTGSMDTDGISKDTLYNTMAKIGGNGSTLNIDHGNISGPDQDWQCVPGEEFSVSHPTETPGISKHLRIRLEDDDSLKIGQERLDLGSKVKNDPFNKLPYDILYTIFSYLPGKSLVAFLTSSWPVYCATHNNAAFWRHRIHSDMPWFWELQELTTMQLDIQALDYKLIHRCLDLETAPKFGMERRFLGIANRRRIWESCEQIADMYDMEHFPQTFPVIYKAGPVFEHSRCPQMSVTSYPPPPGMSTRSTSVQLIYSWVEIDSLSPTFEMYWKDGTLKSVGANFGTRKRLFGSANDSLQISDQRIDRNDWIDQLILYTTRMNLLNDESYMAIVGVGLVLRSGSVSMQGVCSGPRRVLKVSKGADLVGLTGEIRKDGVISRLGILEFPRPTEDGVPPTKPHPSQAGFADTPLIERLLWAPGYDPGYRSDIPPHIRILDFPNFRDTLYPENLINFVPHEIIFWAKTRAQLPRMKRISAYVASSSSNVNQTAVLGLRVEYQPQGKDVGQIETQTNANYLNWTEEHLDYFEIDGPGGEYVTEIEVGWVDELETVALVLRTNRGRKKCFGKARLETQWFTERASEEEAIVGLVLGFRGEGRFNHETRQYPPSTLRSVMALAMKV